MRLRLAGTALLVSALACQGEAPPAEQDTSASAETSSGHLTPMIALHQADEPVFGPYAPRAAPFRRGGREPDPSEVKSPAELARETLEYTESDYVFAGGVEGGVEEALPAFQQPVRAMVDAGASVETAPFVVKMEKLSEDPDAAAHVDQQLDAGVSGIMFVHVESAEELRTGLDAMRFTSDGGTRSEDDLGMAPEYWGLSEEEYREQADLWPLDPDGERVVDEEAWEGAIHTVLDACDAHALLCGFPAGPDDIEARMAQGFDVFVMGWGDSGFRTIERGHEAAGR